jgi:hypothetical protein
MINHVSIGVRDLARAKRFYDAALKPLGYACLSEDAASLGYGRDAAGLWILAAKNPVRPTTDRASTSASTRRPARASTPSTRRRLRRAGATTARRGLAPITGRTTMPLSRSTPTATASRPIAAGRREALLATSGAAARLFRPHGGNRRRVASRRAAWRRLGVERIGQVAAMPRPSGTLPSHLKHSCRPKSSVAGSPWGTFCQSVRLDCWDELSADDPLRNSRSSSRCDRRAGRRGDRGHTFRC